MIEKLPMQSITVEQYIEAIKDQFPDAEDRNFSDSYYSRLIAGDEFTYLSAANDSDIHIFLLRKIEDYMLVILTNSEYHSGADTKAYIDAYQLWDNFLPFSVSQLTSITSVTDKPYTVVNQHASISGTYTGEWANDKPNGKGVFINGESGSTLDGAIFWEKGSKLEGRWVNGLVEGRGEFNAPMDGNRKGDNYLGGFLRGLQHSWGMYTWANGDRYMGGWSKGLPHSWGMYTKEHTAEEEGYEYMGMYENGLMSGEGKVTFNDGTIYEGSFEKGNFHGDVVVKYTSGEIFDCVFEDGVLISSKQR